MNFEHIKNFADLADHVGNMFLANNVTLSKLQQINGDLQSIDTVYQFYIISKPEFLLNFTDELVFYDEEFSVYIWGITHFGTSWCLVPAPEFHEKKN